MRLMDSYVNSIHTREDIALNISKVSPASVFELAIAEIADAGVMSQRRFDSAVRRCYNLYEDYVRQKTGNVQKYMYMSTSVKIDGKWVWVTHPPIDSLSKDTSDFPTLPKANFSISESIVSGAWHVSILLVWNVAFLLLSYFCFLRYDVR